MNTEVRTLFPYVYIHAYPYTDLIYLGTYTNIAVYHNECWDLIYLVFQHLQKLGSIEDTMATWLQKWDHNWASLYFLT